MIMGSNRLAVCLQCTDLRPQALLGHLRALCNRQSRLPPQVPEDPSKTFSMSRQHTCPGRGLLVIILEGEHGGLNAYMHTCSSHATSSILMHALAMHAGTSREKTQAQPAASSNSSSQQQQQQPAATAAATAFSIFPLSSFVFP